MKKRKMMLAGLITSTAVMAFITVMFVIGLTLILDILSDPNLADESYTSVIVVAVLELAVMLTSVVLNAASITAYGSEEKLNKKRPLIVTGVVFNFIVILIFFISLCSGSGGLISILYIGGILTGTILTLVGMNKKLDTPAQVESTPVNVQPQAPSYAQNEDEDKLTAELNKLAKLRDSNIITEQEYQQLKTKRINDHLNK